jgi:hypothetical protein
MTDSALGWRDVALDGVCSTTLPPDPAISQEKEANMDLRILPTYVMLAITEDWLSNSLIASEITSHRLGVGLWAEVDDAHHSLAGNQQRRLSLENQVTGLTVEITDFDDTHDRMARCLYYFLNGLIESTDDPEEADKYRAIKAALFPDDLRVVSFSYPEEAGAIVDMERRVSADMLRTMESIPVGSLTLADVYRAWVGAGKALGRCVQERAALQASLKSDGSNMPEANGPAMRFQWIRAVRMLLDARDIIGMSRKAQERLMAPLEHGIATAQRRHQGGATPDDTTAPDTTAPDTTIDTAIDTAPPDALPDTADTLETAMVTAPLVPADAQAPDAP